MGIIAESLMLICFGFSWPISVYKSYKSRTSAGKSLIFMTVIIIGYFCGVAGKIATGNVNYVLVLYIINMLMVSTDIALYFRNKHLDTKRSLAIA